MNILAEAFINANALEWIIFSILRNRKIAYLWLNESNGKKDFEMKMKSRQNQIT